MNNMHSFCIHDDDEFYDCNCSTSGHSILKQEKKPMTYFEGKKKRKIMWSHLLTYIYIYTTNDKSIANCICDLKYRVYGQKKFS